MKKGSNTDIDKIKKFLLKLGFVCNSQPFAQQLVFCKGKEIVSIKNNKKNKK
jgi:hypothetical protein